MLPNTTIQLPKASTVAHRIDSVSDLVFWVSVLFFILVVGAMVYFAWAYHRSKKGRTTGYILDDHRLEFLWTVVPAAFMLFIFAWGAIVYMDLRRVPPNAFEVNVIGRQWLWNFEYANGRKTMNDLYVPKNRPVKLIMTSEDVLHSFFVPNFRLKQDVVPGMYNYISFEAIIAGEHPIYCTEFCGTGHSDMLGRVFVLEEKDFDYWYETGKLPAGLVIGAPNGGQGPATTGGDNKKTLAETGKDVFSAKGCFACHSVDGTPKVGPTFKGVYGHDVELADGSKVKVDENYIRESLMDPNLKVVKGFVPSMPTFRGLLTDTEINALIAYIKSLK